MKAQPKLKIRKGDLVQVTAGDSKGKQGKVLEVKLATNRVIVEGANMVSKHTKPNAAAPNGGIVKWKPVCIFLMLCLLMPNLVNQHV